MNISWLVLIASTIVFDSWRTYLKIRNIRSINKMQEVPLEMIDLITDEDFTKMKNAQFRSCIVATLSIIYDLGLKLIKLLTFYDRFIWDCTASYGRSSSLRAALHPLLDRFVSECIRAPIAAYGIWIRAAYPMPIWEVFIRAIIDIALETIWTGSVAFGFVQITDRYGKLSLPVVMIILHSIGVYLFIFYITQVLTYISVPLGEDEVGRNLKTMGNRVGYPHEKIRITIADTSGQDVHYYRMLGYEMVLVARRILRILVPNQVTAIVTQELGHWKFRHHAISNFFGLADLLGYCCALVMSYGNESINGLFGFYTTHPYIPLYLTTRYIWPIFKMSITGICNLVKRLCVFQADDYATDQGVTSPLRTGLLVMAATFRSLPLFDSWHSAWYFGQPTILERVARLNKRRQKLNVTFQSISSNNRSLSPADSIQSDESSRNPSLETAEDGKHLEQTNQEKSLKRSDQLLQGTLPEKRSESSQTEDNKLPRTILSQFDIHRRNSDGNRHSLESVDSKHHKKGKKGSNNFSVVKDASPQPSEAPGSTESQKLRKRSSIQEKKRTNSPRSSSPRKSS